MAKTPIPAKHLQIFREVYRYLGEISSEKKPIASLGNLPLSMELEEAMLRNYRKNILTTTKIEPKQKLSQLSTIRGKTPGIPTTLDTSLKAATKEQLLEQLHKKIYSCRQCPLAQRRKQATRLSALPQAKIFFLSDIVSFNDQLNTHYFSDAVGKVFLNILKALALDRNSIYISSCIKCASTTEISNKLDSMKVCLNHLHEEIDLLQPKLIIAFGEDSYRLLIKENPENSKEKKDFQEILGSMLSFRSVDIMFTHHPREMLYDPTLKKQTWEHLKPLLPRLAAF